MLIAFLARKTFERQEITVDNEILLKEALWIDLLRPTKEEENIIEKYLNIDIPTREDMVEIELSSRLYEENNIFFMTAAMIAHHDSPDPIIDPVTFILAHKQLVTVRYIEPTSFDIFNARLQKREIAHRDGLSLLMDLLDATIDRLADALELIGHRLDEYSKNIFRPSIGEKEKPDYRRLMQQIGMNGDLNTKARESLMTLNRLTIFLEQIEDIKLDANKIIKLTTLSRDIDSLSHHANFLSTKVNFVLDAILGMVNIEQNKIIKIFSVAAVIFLPPTLIASIYGMNFHFIPELSWKYGYLFAIGMILIAAWLPYKYFKHRKWL